MFTNVLNVAITSDKYTQESQDDAISRGLVVARIGDSNKGIYFLRIEGDRGEAYIWTYTFGATVFPRTF